MTVTSTLKNIWNSKNSGFFIFLICVMIAGLFLYFDRPSVRNKTDLLEIKGTLQKINQILVYTKRIHKTERDSTYHIYLNEYPCKFQVSYFHYDRESFYRTSHSNDSIRLHIAQNDEKFLSVPNKRIRSFSLNVNKTPYVSVDQGLSGFGKGYFEIGMILIPLIVIILLFNKNKNN
jgi:hypothetical protein